MPSDVDRRILFPRRFLPEITRQRVNHHPEEACALVFGSMIIDENKQVFEIKEIHFTENILHSPSAFEIDPVDYYSIIKKEEENKNALVGILHTHPSNQFVSASDEKYMKNAAEHFKSAICWLIAGDGENAGDGLDIGAYYVKSGTILQIPISYV